MTIPSAETNSSTLTIPSDKTMPSIETVPPIKTIPSGKASLYVVLPADTIHDAPSASSRESISHSVEHIEQPLYVSASTQYDVSSRAEKSAQTLNSTRSSLTQTVETEELSSDIPDGFIQCLIPLPPMPLGNNYHKKQFIVNEVLCYIQNKMDTLPIDKIVKLGSDFFSHTDITTAKKLLHQTAPVKGLRLRMHRGENKAKLDFKDMILHLLNVPLMEMPIFLSRDLTMIPPSAYDTYDTTAILRNMESMKSQIDMLTEAQKVTSELITSLPLADNRLQINRNNPQQRAPGELMTPNPPKESVTQSVANSKNHSEEQQVDIKVMNNDNDEEDDDDDYDDDDSDNDDEDVDTGDDDYDNDDDDVDVNNEDTDVEDLQIPSAQSPKVNNLSTIEQYRGGKISNSCQKHWSKHTSLKTDKDSMYSYSNSGSKQTIGFTDICK